MALQFESLVVLRERSKQLTSLSLKCLMVPGVSFAERHVRSILRSLTSSKDRESSLFSHSNVDPIFISASVSIRGVPGFRGNPHF